MAIQTPAYLLPGYGITDLQSGDTIDPTFLPAGSGVTSVNGSSGVVVIDKITVGLSNVDNTSDVNKPVSSAATTALAGKAASVHTHAPSDITGTAVVTADSRLSDARTPLAHNQAWSTITTLPTTVAGYGITDAGIGDAVQSVAPVSGATQTFNIVKKNELIALTQSATIAAQTIVFPSDANSQLGQELGVFARSIVTAVTLTTTGLTIYGLALTTLPVSGIAKWKKVATSTWVRVQ